MTASAPRTLIVTSSSTGRGAETEAAQLAANLRAEGFPTLVRSVTAGSPPHIEGLEPLGRWRHSPSTLIRLRRLAADADVVIAYGSRALPACALALADSSTPFVYRSIGDPAAWIRSDLHRRITAIQYRRAAAVAVLWPAAAASVSRLFDVSPNKIDTIPNARDPNAFGPVADSNRAQVRNALGFPPVRTAVFIGRLSPEKQVSLAIEAIGLTGGWHLVVVGDGPERGAAERMAAAMAPGRVRFLGHRQDVPQLLSAADALIITSKTEGMPGVAIEAALTGVPVVAPPVGALAAMPGVTVASPSASHLAAALQSIRPKTRLREFALSRYSWDVVTAQWAQLLTAVAGREHHFGQDATGSGGHSG